jgi:Asp-tRNA(Asn)/Glu-tRNA(Gln) amidotransferase A subunit family amidase
MGLKIELPDPRSELDGGAAGLRLAWTDDYGFASTYAVEESSRVIARIRDSAFGLSALGAVVEETEEHWEDYRDALNTHRMVFTDMPVLGPEAGAAVPEEQWEAATQLRQRTYECFRRLFREHDLLLCPTIQTVAPTVDRWRHWWSGSTEMAKGRLGMDGYAIFTAMYNWLAFPSRFCAGGVRGRAARRPANCRAARKRPENPPARQGVLRRFPNNGKATDELADIAAGPTGTLCARLDGALSARRPFGA